METQTDPFTERLNLLLEGLKKIDPHHCNPLSQLRQLVAVTKDFGCLPLADELTALENGHLENTPRYEDLSSLKSRVAIILLVGESLDKVEASLAARILHGHVKPMMGIIKRVMR